MLRAATSFHAPKQISVTPPAMPITRWPVADPVSSIARTVTATEASWPIAIGSERAAERAA